VQLYNRLTVRQNLVLAHYRDGRAGVLSSLLSTPLARRDRLATLERANGLIDALGLDEVAEQYCMDLPYGLQRLVSVARALAVTPELLMLDEPSAGLGPGESEQLGRLIKRIRDRLGIPVLLIEHDMSLVMSISDYVYVLDFGVPLADGAPEDVRAEPSVVAAYLGEEVADD
jgi:ABC-type branched-subunit amino acid transport system ATPase component